MVSLFPPPGQPSECIKGGGAWQCNGKAALSESEEETKEEDLQEWLGGLGGIFH